MSTVKISGNSSGTGTFEIIAPSSNTDRTQTLPDVTGTLVSTGSISVVTQSMLATAVIPLGVNQTWQDLTGSRALGTTYTNSTGRSIQVSISATCGVSGSIDLQLTIGGVLVGRQYQVPPGGFTAVGTCSGIVPSGTTYSVTAAGAASFTWQELR